MNFYFPAWGDFETLPCGPGSPKLTFTESGGAPPVVLLLWCSPCIVELKGLASMAVLPVLSEVSMPLFLCLHLSLCLLLSGCCLDTAIWTLAIWTQP